MCFISNMKRYLFGLISKPVVRWILAVHAMAKHLYVYFWPGCCFCSSPALLCGQRIVREVSIIDNRLLQLQIHSYLCLTWYFQFQYCLFEVKKKFIIKNYYVNIYCTWKFSKNFPFSLVLNSFCYIILM